MNDKRYTIYGTSNDLGGIQEAIDLVKENERLNNIIEDINIRIEQRMNENISNELRIELKNIELISKGIIKVVK